MRKVFAALFAIGLLAPVAQASADMPKPKPVNPKSKGTPGPVAGAGLPFIILAGAYWLYRRRKCAAKTKAEQ